MKAAEDVDFDTRYPHVIVCEGAVVDRTARIQSFSIVESGAVIGARVTIKPFNLIGDGCVLEEDVFVGSGVTFANNRHPKSNDKKDAERILVKRGASLGMGALVMPGVTIGEAAMVGAGALVNHDVPDGATVVGMPARLLRGRK